MQDKHNRAGMNYPSVFVLMALGLILICAGNAAAAELYFVDAHSQVDETVYNLELIIRKMDSAGVDRTILAARSGRTPTQIADFAQLHPERIVPAVRTKSGAYRKNRAKYYKKMRKQLDSGRFKAMAEILLYHARKGTKAPEITVYPDDQRVQYALDAAIAKKWPFVIHIEFSSLKGPQKTRFMEGMEKMLAAHPKHPFVLNHLGQLQPPQVQRLIENHPNLYFLTAHTTPVITRLSDQPWVNMFDGSVLTAKWKTLILKHSERFVFALDNVWGRHWKEFYPAQMKYWRQAMADLPHDTAHALAHGNAERLWKIPAKQAWVNMIRR